MGSGVRVNASLKTPAMRGSNALAMEGLLSAAVRELSALGVELEALGFAWARVLPSAALVPALGLRALPGPARAVLGLSLAVVAAPALSAVASTEQLPWWAALGREFLLGVPVALSASAALFIANMAGGAVDNLRGARQQVQLPHVNPGSTPLGALLVLLVAIAFLESGGVERIISALLVPTLEFSAPLLRASLMLSSGIEVAVAIAAPVLVASVLFEVASALIARAASPAYILPLLAPLRSLVLLAVFGLVLERAVTLLALLSASQP